MTYANQAEHPDSVLFVSPEQFMAMINVIEKAKELVKIDLKKDLPINHNEARLELVQAIHLLEQHGGIH
jgi:hypothetical protein